MANEYAMYRGEELLAIGTAREIAEKMGIKTETVYYYNTTTYRKKLKTRKHGEGGNYPTVTKIS